MSNLVAPRGAGGGSAAQSLYAVGGARKYINASERAALRAHLALLPVERRLFVLTIMWTGARVSEVLALTAASFQIEAGVVAIRTLKRRGHFVREIPIPPDFMVKVAQHFRLVELQAAGADNALWSFHRVTAWRIIKNAMESAGVTGVRASPRGLRHAFGVTTLAAGLPLDLVQRLLGHASIKTTTIYTEAAGPEQRVMTARFWRYAG